jgi:hypothetical protein
MVLNGCSWCYTDHEMKALDSSDDPFLNPPPGSAAERAVEFGIDLTLTLDNLRLTPEERIRKLDEHLAGIASLKANAKFLGKYEEWRARSE